MPKVDEESARLALMELAEAFGSDDNKLLEHIEIGKIEMQPPELLPIAMDGRLYLEDGKAVYILRTPIEQANGEKICAFRLKEPTAADYLVYAKGMTATVSREGGMDVDMVMMAKRTLKAVARLSGHIETIVERMSRKDLSDLTDIGDALGFFD